MKDPNPFLILACVLIVAILICAVFPPNRGAIDKKTASESIEKVKVTKERLEQIKQSLTNMDLPLPLTVKEKQLTDLKQELLQMVEDIEKNRLEALLEIAKETEEATGRVAKLIEKYEAMSAKRDSGRSPLCPKCGYAHDAKTRTAREAVSRCRKKFASETIFKPDPESRYRCIQKGKPCSAHMRHAKLKEDKSKLKCSSCGDDHVWCDKNKTKKQAHNHNSKKKDIVTVTTIIEGINPEIAKYLEDDTFELKEGMTKIEVDKILGTPDVVKSCSSSDDLKVVDWEYGNWREDKSKLKGRYYQRRVKFTDGKVDWWDQRAIVKIKTHQRADIVISHLDEEKSLSKRIGKTEVYKFWGLPNMIDVCAYNDEQIQTTWYFKTEGEITYSHFASFVNNRLCRWGDM